MSCPVCALLSFSSTFSMCQEIFLHIFVQNIIFSSWVVSSSARTKYPSYFIHKFLYFWKIFKPLQSFTILCVTTKHHSFDPKLCLCPFTRGSMRRCPQFPSPTKRPNPTLWNASRGIRLPISWSTRGKEIKIFLNPKSSLSFIRLLWRRRDASYTLGVVVPILRTI